MRIAKINNQRYRRFREKTLPLYQIQSVSAEMVDQGRLDILEFARDDLRARLELRLRARHAFDKRSYKIEGFQEYDIDYNRYRVGVRQIFS